MLYKTVKLIVTALLGCILSTAPFKLLANSPIKSVDESGNVTYSDKAPADAVSVKKVPLHAGPSKSEINTAQKQAAKNINTAEKIDLNNNVVKRKAKPKATAPKTEYQPDVIYSGAARRNPYANKPRPKLPIQRPGINPPPAHPPARRPRAGGR